MFGALVNSSFVIILNLPLYKQQLHPWFGLGICQYFIPLRITERDDSKMYTLAELGFSNWFLWLHSV